MVDHTEDPAGCDSRQVLPDEYYRLLHKEGDVEGAYRELEGIAHFYADTMRGHLRMLLNHFDEAEVFFEKAERASRTAPRTPHNLMRMVMLDALRLQHSLYHNKSFEPKSGWPPDLPVEISSLASDSRRALRALTEKYPETCSVLNYRKHSEGLFRLFKGHAEEARTIFRELVEDSDDQFSAMRAANYLALGAANYNLGDHEEAMVYFENAGWTAQGLDYPLQRLRVSSVLKVFYRFLEDIRSARDWQEFFDRVDCPEVTRSAFYLRSKILLQRCQERRDLLVY